MFQGLPAGSRSQWAEAGQAAPRLPTLLKYLFFFFRLASGDKAFPESRVQVRPASCPHHTSIRELASFRSICSTFCRKRCSGTTVKKKPNTPSLVSESVSWRSASSGTYSHAEHNMCTVCGKKRKKQHFHNNYS